ncbi:hypothetical protein NKJ52_20595 [Mesorhizobium australicum]|uniref:hypothetical protein n=1 Tax=Mesorhizobium australicum TaxID=536018 RepID=UPI00333D00E8
MLDELHNSGIEVFNDQPIGRTLTIIVAGVPRSGTTMVAKALQSLGVFLGDEIDASVQEDLRLSAAIEQNNQEISDIVAAYNRAHSVWGFKRPTAYQTIDLRLFRNPRLVLTFRDPVAIAKREEISMVSDFRIQLRRAAEWSLNLTDFALQQTVPTMLVSYEKALQNPQAFIWQLARYIGVTPSWRVARSAAASIKASPSDYLEKSQVRFPRKPS